MEVNVITELINKVGVPVALVIYFLWKDYKFTDQINKVMSEIKTLMETLTEAMIKKDAA